MKLMLMVCHPRLQSCHRCPHPQGKCVLCFPSLIPSFVILGVCSWGGHPE